MSHRVPFERDFEGAIERPDWESSQAGGVIQIPKGIAFSLVETRDRQWGRLVRMRETELGEGVSVEGERDKIFTVWSMREVKGNCQGRLVRPVGQTS